MNTREILFRGKRIDNGEWIIGDGIHKPKSINYKGTVWIDGMEDRANDWIPIIPETVGEYTGLKDKNGVKIFEGDIVKGQSLYKYGGFEYLGVVRWGNQNYLIGWLVSNASGDWDLRACSAKISLDNITGEIIGNIYDNPELLKEYEV